MNEPTGGGRRHLIVDQVLPLLGLAGFGYSLPLLDLLGTNPEFLVSHYLTGATLVIAALAVALVPPLVAAASVVLATWLSPRVGRLLWCGWVLVFATMAAGSLLRHLDLPSEALQLLLATAGGALLLIAALRWRSARTGFALLAATPLIAVIALVTWSPSAELVWQGDVGAIEDVEVTEPAPVIVLQLDELPLASLLRPDGSIDAERFPNFARLARESTWYADAVAVAPSTIASVPAALTGRIPVEGELPTAADHPRNLFTLLGASYDLQVDEPVTALCPNSLCGGSVDWGGMAHDAVGVAGQLWLPPGLRGRLPSEVREAADFENVDALGGDSARQRASRLAEHIDDLHAGGDRPPLWYAHVVLPHVPWSLGRSGAEYRTDAAVANGPNESGDWGDDPVLTRMGLQRHLLQVGATDRLLGRLIDRAREQGLWDDAVVVVVADHGAAFDPERPYRRPTTATAHEIYRVPLFVKVPGQDEAETRFDLTYNVDVLPTILDVVGVDPEAGLNGRSILEPVADRPPDAALYVADATSADEGGAIHPDIEYQQVIDVARRNAEVLPAGPGWHGVVAGGPLGAQVGRPLADLEVEGTSAFTFDLEQRSDLADVDTADTGILPSFVWGTLRGADGNAPTDLLLVLDGMVSGALSRLEGTDRYAGVVDEDLVRQGANEVQVLVPEGDGSFATVLPSNP